MKELLSRLDVETFVLDLQEELTTAPELTETTGELLDAKTLEIRVAKGQSINQVFSQLTAQNIKVLSMRNKTNRLEEFFFKLVEKGKA